MAQPSPAGGLGGAVRLPPEANAFWQQSIENCRIHHVTVSIATRILIANLGQIDLSNKVCLINLV